ncbi:MAG: glutamate synthase central domain-containing protein, partial [Spirochaetota bacterium]
MDKIDGQNSVTRQGYPLAQGLYDPKNEHDACGIGFVASIKGEKTHKIVRSALKVLERMSHRGASCEDKETGDGAGILIQIPHDFLLGAAADQGLTLPEAGGYAVGMAFLPTDPITRALVEGRIELIARDEGLSFIGWRTVPVDRSTIGKKAVASMPFIRQFFITRPDSLRDDLDFERRLYVVRKRVERMVEGKAENDPDYVYIPSLSGRTLVYKGLMKGDQVEAFYLDLRHASLASAIAVVHSRFSTNTFPSWERAHPYRYLIHNGEINTLKSNVNWMKAREPMIRTEMFGDDSSRVSSIINENGSDSSMFDNCLEFLYLTGRPLAHSMMMMIPEPWENREDMSDGMRAFYEYHACLMEPWDGPAAMVFSDGKRVGALLDRNGLRPARYIVTKEGMVIMASEAGVLNIPAEDIEKKEKLMPGSMLLIDTEEGRIIPDEEIKKRFAGEKPYRQWLDERLVKLEDLDAGPEVRGLDPDELKQKQSAFGYTNEDLELTILPMARDGLDPVSSMGYDAPLAVLSDRPQLLFSYFKQLFAQVTNPPIDSVREEIVIGTSTFIGSEGDLINPTPEACRQIKFETPMIDNEDMARLRSMSLQGFKPLVMPILYPVADGPAALERAMERLFSAADAAFESGVNLMILSDRGMDAKNAPIPSLLAVSGLHHHLIRNGRRTLTAIALESGEPREVHHFAALIGYGASAVNPYMALESVEDLCRRGFLPGLDPKDAVAHFIKAATKGVIKTMTKMGISTIQSYKGAQIFEAVGLGEAFVDRYFEGTPSRIGGLGLREICAETSSRHLASFDPRRPRPISLETGGEWKWRGAGEHHSYNPESIHLLQLAVRKNDYKQYEEYARLTNDPVKGNRTLRSLLRWKAAKAVSLDEVESVESIWKRFKSGAMSYGSISK